jgi:hypothetical protein
MSTNLDIKIAQATKANTEFVAASEYRDAKQLRAKQLSNSPPSGGTDSRAVTHVYRPFFIAGMLSVLTAGCLLGAVALMGIALQGSFTANSWTPYVLAHANNQLYGWVGFFVIGFALQQHAPRRSRLTLFYRLAWASLLLMGVGIGIRFAAEPLVPVQPAVWMPLGVLSTLMQLAAVLIFIVNIGLTRFRTGEGLTWQSKFVFAALGWWMLVAAAEPFFFVAGHGPGRTAFVAEWFTPYREAQFLGFVAMMIFGVALVKMHSCFGFQKATRSLGETGFYLWNLGLLLRMAGWVTGHRSGFAQMELFHFGGIVLAAGAVLLVAATRVLDFAYSSNRSQKFVRAAFAWLLVSGLLIVLEPLHLRAIGEPFSHAFTGAIRHAVTVGFISQMIIGVSLTVVARMNDLEDSTLPALWSVFVLLNLGNAARVFLEIGTDYTPGAFLPMGFTGFVELVALGIWAVAIGRPMLRTLRPTPVTAPSG